MGLYTYNITMTGSAQRVLSAAATRTPGDDGYQPEDAAANQGSDRAGIPLYPLPFFLRVQGGDITLSGSAAAANAASAYPLLDGEQMSGLLAEGDEIWAEGTGVVSVAIARQLTVNYEIGGG